MASGAQSFYSTPAFEIFRRGLTVNTVKKFRGIDAYQSVTSLNPDTAQDCLNVMIPGSGGISKFRLPVQLSAAPPNIGAGPFQVFDFQQSTGTRQVVSVFAQSLFYYTWNSDTQLSVAVQIDTGPADAQPWSMVEANQLLFGSNGLRMMKWTGAAFQPWGIVGPVTAPRLGLLTTTLAPPIGLSRAAGIVTVQIAAALPVDTKVGDTIVISNSPDPSFNGSFPVATIISQFSFTYVQAGANATSGNANVQFFSEFASFNLAAGPNGAVRVNGVATYKINTASGKTGAFQPILPGIDPGASPLPQVTFAGVADGTFNGTFPVTTIDATGTILTVLQPGLPDSASGGGTVVSAFSPAQGVTWSYAYGNSTVMNFSNVSPPSTVFIGTNRSVRINAIASTDPQVDVIAWFRTIDGGGDQFLHSITNIAAGGLVLTDLVQDGNLNQTIQGPLLNFPPPVGKFTAVGQSRVFIGNLTGTGPNPGGSTDIAYSGYEQILLGRPEECFPPFNRIRLQIGADPIAGIGILQSGVVGFSVTKKMYMLRGNIEDISINAPVAFSAYLEELPWNVGTMCHQSIQPTSYGLIFWASDRTVQLFSGSAKPQDISRPVYPILRRATKGREAFASSTYFNWLERDWYGLCLAIDGSFSNNYTIFWSLNAAGEIDIFPCNIQMDCMATVSSVNLQRLLVIGQQGRVMNLPVSQDTQGGIADPSIIPATVAQLPAYWRSGYFGNDSPQRSKNFRRGFMVTDTDGFKVTKRFVNNQSLTVMNPKIMGPHKTKNGGSFSIGQRANRCSIEINFPDQDVASNVLELSIGYIGTGDRL